MPKSRLPSTNYRILLADHGRVRPSKTGLSRPKIAALVHPKMVPDLVDPLTVFNLGHSEIHLVGKTLDRLPTETDLTIALTTRFSDCPSELDILFASSGLDGTIELMVNPETVGFLREQGFSSERPDHQLLWCPIDRYPESSDLRRERFRFREVTVCIAEQKTE